jgi:hypothetical protein
MGRQQMFKGWEQLPFWLKIGLIAWVVVGLISVFDGDDTLGEIIDANGGWF